MALNQVFVMNSGSLQEHAYADPSAVPDGVIAAFDGEGNPIEFDDNDGGADDMPEQIQFVLGGDEPFISQMIDTATMKVTAKAYAAPVKQVTSVDNIAAGAANARRAVVRVEDLSLRPSFARLTYDVSVGA